MDNKYKVLKKYNINKKHTPKKINYKFFYSDYKIIFKINIREIEIDRKAMYTMWKK